MNYKFGIRSKGKTHLYFFVSFGFASKITSITKNEQRTKQPATAATEPSEQSAANSRSTNPFHPPPIPQPRLRELRKMSSTL